MDPGSTPAKSRQNLVAILFIGAELFCAILVMSKLGNICMKLFEILVLASGRCHFDINFLALPAFYTYNAAELLCNFVRGHYGKHLYETLTLLILVLNIWTECLPGDKNISILYLSCRTSDLQFSLLLQIHALVL